MGRPAAPGTTGYVIESPDVLKLAARARGKEGTVTWADVNGNYLIRPDGTVSLGKFGELKAAGLTTDLVKDAVRGHLVAAFARTGRDARVDAGDVSVAVSAYNSKRYYVITSGPKGQESVYPFSVSGKETVLDAIGKVDGLADPSGGAHI